MKKHIPTPPPPPLSFFSFSIKQKNQYYDQRLKRNYTHKVVINYTIISIDAGKLSRGSSHQFLSGGGNHMAFLLPKAMLR